MGADEPIDGVLTITATAAGEAPYTGQIGTAQVKVGQRPLYSITPGSTDTVTIDGIEWYCLAKDDGKALIWAKEPVEQRQFHSTAVNVWRDSDLRTYLNGEWLESKAVLKTKAIQTDITTRSQYNATDWITTQDKVFLLSDADLFGTVSKIATSNAQDYTYGNSILVPDVNMRGFTSGSYVWLRSPCGGTYVAARVDMNGNITSTYDGTVTGRHSVRPALWVSLAS